MKLIFGAALTCGMIAIPGYIVWRIVVDVESWFATSGAGDCIMWSFVIALMLTAFAIPVGVWGLAARMWVVRLERGQYLVSTAHTLQQLSRRRAHLTTVETEALLAPQETHVA